jgi:UDP-N-acetyl-D-glucosamine/UDP-N-acetyl-D-galactosamine dehydrogenase
MEKICVVGLGYVGLPLAVAFAEKGFLVVGIDNNHNRIKQLKNYHDSTKEVSHNRLCSVIDKSYLILSSDYVEATESTTYIITVPTPIKQNFIPDLAYCVDAAISVSALLQKNDLVIFESTVFPGATEEVLSKKIEECSGYKVTKDIYLGYSPERINPGDKINTLRNVTKVVSGCCEESSFRVRNLYSQICDNIYLADNIRVAEAAKITENIQRDVNIALMNELKMIYDNMSVDINSVLAACRTKWNFVNFIPGLVGGHCIGIDPYYLLDTARKMSQEARLINSARVLNEGMINYHYNKLLESIILNNIETIAFCGVTFKSDCSDMRNSKYFELYKKIASLGVTIRVYDPYVDRAEFTNIEFLDSTYEVSEDLVIIGTKHTELSNLLEDGLFKERFIYDI